MNKKVTLVIAGTMVATTLAIIALLVAAAPYKPKQVVATPSVQQIVVKTPTYSVPAEVQPIVDRLGLDPVLVSHLQIIIPDDASMCTGLVNGTPTACYGGGKLYFPRAILSRPQSVQSTIFAHEYMHYIRSIMTEEEREKYAIITGNLYEQYQSVRDRVKDYPAEAYANELHSYICTEMRTEEIPKELLDHCLEYVPNRSVLRYTF